MRLLPSCDQFYILSHSILGSDYSQQFVLTLSPSVKLVGVLFVISGGKPPNVFGSYHIVLASFSTIF